MEKSLFDQSLEIIQKTVAGTKFVEQDGSTGISWFEGKSRLVKLVKTKRNISLEINQDLAPELEALDGMEKISKTKAHQKHLGTMKYLYKTNEIKNILSIITNALENYELSKNSQNEENSK